MKIVNIEESRERCVEAGWMAYDILFSVPMEKEFIRSLKDIGGAFMFLEVLKKPFFKLEAEHYLLRGVLGDSFLRLAVHMDYPEEMERIKKCLILLADR